MDDRPPLTHLEARVLAAVERYIRANGEAPTIAELTAELRLRSKGTVHRYVQSLIAKGRIERYGNGWRGLRIVGLKMPERSSNVERLPLPERPGSVTPLPGESNVGVPIALPADLEESGFTRGELRIPLLGRIAAGRPIEAIGDESHLDLVALLVGPDRYALRVSGESMVDIGILDGDTIIVRKQETAERGDIVVALIDGQEATLKRLGETTDDTIELIAENRNMAPLRYASSRVRLQGVLVGQLRGY